MSNLIYEVNLKISKSIESDYLRWLKEHQEEMLKFDGFESYTNYSRAPQEEGLNDHANIYLTVHYYVKDRKCLDKYFKDHAAKMRDNGIKKFGNKFSATRRILTNKGNTCP